MSLIEVGIPSEEGNTKLSFDGKRWKALEQTEDSDNLCRLLHTYTGHTIIGDHHTENPLVYRTMCGLSVIGGRITKQPKQTSLPEDAVA